MQTKKSEVWVGIFMLMAIAAIVFLCLRVADVKSFGTRPTWTLYATFDNIGGLKTNSPVKIGGVVIGRVTDIALDEKSYLPRVTMAIDEQYNQLPDTSSLAIRTSGLLGEQYLALNVGFDDPEMGTAMLKDGDTLRDTKSAMVLEDLIGQFLYKSGGDEDNKSQAESAPDNAAPAVTGP
ncbi:outer membrane lipid asymmetry maintenance protein MlaD [Pantoea sp. 1.19]|uniref:outer membrane lipid asymmetry maintenance protein MlaD n=1 Tax=Pantoea sp. 1.19 TaxID=1925589 RepID=UPI000948FD74|nr:outer membrane lipid asymmetry maintenance protein MlaD [Pantoea sp. 1.19]